MTPEVRTYLNEIKEKNEAIRELVSALECIRDDISQQYKWKTPYEWCYDSTLEKAKTILNATKTTT